MMFVTLTSHCAPLFLQTYFTKLWLKCFHFTLPTENSKVTRSGVRFSEQRNADQHKNRHLKKLWQQGESRLLLKRKGTDEGRSNIWKRGQLNKEGMPQGRRLKWGQFSSEELRQRRSRALFLLHYGLLIGGCSDTIVVRLVCASWSGGPVGALCKRARRLWISLLNRCAAG